MAFYGYNNYYVGTWVQICEMKNGKLTGNSIFVGHLASITRGLVNGGIISMGQVLGIMGATGANCFPAGFIHAHAELRFCSDANNLTNYTLHKELGGISGW